MQTIVDKYGFGRVSLPRQFARRTALRCRATPQAWLNAGIYAGGFALQSGLRDASWLPEYFRG